MKRSVIFLSLMSFLLVAGELWGRDAAFFTLSSTKDIVRSVQGTPDGINRYESLGEEVWSYGLSTVTFSTRTERVMEWNSAGNLHAHLEPGKNVTAAAHYTRGSHKDDVLRLQGTPDAISRYPSLGQEVWSYGLKTVTISLQSNKVVEYSSPGVVTSLESYDRPVLYHHRFEDVTFFYDDDKVYAGAFSFEDDELGIVYGVERDGVAYFYDDAFSPLGLAAYADRDGEIRVSSISGNHSTSTVSRFSSSLGFINISGDISASGTVHQIGDMTFYDLVSHHGEYVHGTSIDLGTISLDNLYSSTGATLSGDRIRIGNISFGNWSDEEGESLSGTSQRIGNMVFHTYTRSDGSSYSGTTMEIGDFSFTSINDW